MLFAYNLHIPSQIIFIYLKSSLLTILLFLRQGLI